MIMSWQEEMKMTNICTHELRFFEHRNLTFKGWRWRDAGWLSHSPARPEKFSKAWWRGWGKALFRPPRRTCTHSRANTSLPVGTKLKKINK